MADCDHCGLAPAVAKGLCMADYEYMRSHEGELRPQGLLMAQLMRNAGVTMDTVARRFMAKVRLDGEHWLWVGGVGPHGFSSFTLIRGKKTPAHRAAYALAGVPLEGKLYNLCGRKLCVRPAHWQTKAREREAAAVDSTGVDAMGRQRGPKWPRIPSVGVPVFENAACATTKVDMFPVAGGLEVRTAGEKEAIALCNTCPHQTACGAFAVRERVEYGVWGGLTESERRAIQRRVNRVA